MHGMCVPMLLAMLQDLLGLSFTLGMNLSNLEDLGFISESCDPFHCGHLRALRPVEPPFNVLKSVCEFSDTVSELTFLIEVFMVCHYYGIPLKMSSAMSASTYGATSFVFLV